MKEPRNIIPCEPPDDKNFLNRIGQTFGKLTVLEYVGKRVHEYGRPNHYWKCLCECGAITIVAGGELGRSKNAIRSCGCVDKARRRLRMTSHGMSKTQDFRRWTSMVQRCTNPKNTNWRNYGARGISVCRRWLKFENFYADMGPIPKGLTLERRDNDGDYEPSNVYWATMKEQARNKRTNHLLTFNGRTMCVMGWADEAGLIKPTIMGRLRKGWPIEKVISSNLFNRFGNPRKPKTP